MIRIAALQLYAYDIRNREEALANALAKIAAAAEGKPDLVILPEAVYPGYFLGIDYDPEGSVADTEKALEAFGAAAARHGFYLSVGVAEKQGDCLYNSAYLFDSRGNRVGSARKSLLWHFDSRWFCSGDSYEVFDTALGPLGLIVCADGRQPEISRILALKGARLIIDVVNWVSLGHDPQSLSNPQYEYMIPARAVENGVWYVAANKVGLEAKSVLYCGRSCIIDPNGKKIASASAHREEIIWADVDLNSENYINPEGFYWKKNRVPEVYSSLVKETLSLQAVQVVKEPLIPGKAALFASVVQLDWGMTLDGYLEEAEKMASAVALQGAKLAVFPDLPCLKARDSYAKVVPVFSALAKKYGLLLVTAACRPQDTKVENLSILFTPEGEQHSYRQVHPSDRENFIPGDTLPVFSTPYGNIAMIKGWDGFLPEVSRVLMLEGADIIAWQGDFTGEYHRLFARTRASENKLFVLAANTSGQGRSGLSLIAAPSGQTPATAFPDGEQAICALLELTSARNKIVVPGTDVLMDRKPGSYRDLVKKTGY